MKFPVTSSPNNQSPNPKPISCNNTARNTGFHSPLTTNNTTNLCYEPTSVLDLRRSPSPLADVPVSGPEVSAVSDVLSQSDDPSFQWDEHMLHNLDWDSIIGDLGLHDDSAQHFAELPPPQPLDHTPFVPSGMNLSDVSVTQPLNPNSNYALDVANWNVVGFDLVEELIRAAGCFDSNEFQLAQVILARLNQRLRSPFGKPLQRAAFYFKEALQSLLVTGSNRPARCSPSEIVQTIKAYKAFSGISPIPMFSNFTSNQVLLETLSESKFIHVIDFDIGFGGQYASFMKEIADKAEACKVNPSVLRVTAVVPEEYVIESRLIRENLCQFAEELKIGFHIELVSIRTFEVLSFKAIKFMEGEKTAVHLSPAIFRRIGSGLVNDLRRISPNVVFFVDGDGCTESGAASFRRSLVEGLEFYSVMLESLDAATLGGTDGVRRIEMFVLRPKIFAAVEAAGRRMTPWREVFAGAGMRPVVLSQFADFQAECLLRKAQVRGFHVAKRQGELVLYWQGRAMVATSAWRC
ncbi:hypothetical protein L1049_025318 [Liquidambar formosana]|uniref:Scarecrow-like protein 15 n=1 Tax=Liquidambar formosana TaxID=63359 RepID=A0AAP0R1X9_LIQFO